MQGKHFVLIMVGVLLILTVMYIGGSATFVKSKADVCQGYVSATERADCAATATVGKPPNLIKYH